METISDVTVVGGGPCGSFAAFNLAKHGVRASVFEEHSEVGVPSHCPGHLSIKGLKQLGLYPLPAGIVENVFYGATFHSSRGRSFSFRFSQPVTCAVNRVLFDRHIAEMAVKAGVQYCLNSRVDSLIIEDGFVKGVGVKQNWEIARKFFAKVVLDAEGISSRILRLAGLSSLNRRMLVNGVHAEVDNVKDTEPDMVEVFLGKDYAPGFYAWLIPERDGKAKIGLAAKAGNPKEFLRRLMLKHPVASKKLHDAKILRVAFHPLTLGGQIAKTFSNGFLVVGDAASQVKPTTGGGVVFGTTCARVAAEVVGEALVRSDFSSRFLSSYQRRCKEILGFDVNVMLKMRRMFDALSDEKVDDAIGFCRRFGMEKVFQNVGEVDFQGTAFLRALRGPRALAALGYFLFSFLANP